MEPIVRTLNDANATLAEVGGKGLNLGILLRAGLPVPGGFVVTTAAYREFVAANDLRAVIDRAWPDALGGDSAALERASATVRAAFENGPIPPSLATALEPACRASTPVAVRSSATAEDLPDASFAGQQDTYLGVNGKPAIQDAIRKCWGSLWTARAMAYRARQRIAPDDVALAVVVQELAPATAAGVLFTVDPVTGASDPVVINATWGLGESLVSGRVNPDTIYADKRTGRVLRADVGEKAIMTSTTGQGTTEVPVDAEQRARRALTDAQVADLVRLGRAAEDLFKCPQDVEWAIVGDRAVLLQSRAVTTLAIPGDDRWPPVERGERQPFDFWTQQDMGERWPDPVTPLTWSVSEPMNQRTMDGMVAGLDAPYAGRIQWTRRVAGHVYLNEGALLHAYTHGFGMPMTLLESALTHPAARPAGAESWQLGRVFRHLPFFIAAATQWEREVALFEADFEKIDGWVDAFMARDLANDGDAELLREARTIWFERVVQYIRYHTRSTSMSMSAYSQLESLMLTLCGDRSLAQVLAGGITGVIAAEMVPAMWELARSLRSLHLESIVLDNAPDAALKRLRDDPSAAPFLALLDRFLARHGHRCMVEAEFRVPRWVERPEPVIEQLAGYLRMPDGPAAAASEQAANKRTEATAKIAREVGWLGRWQFQVTLERLHRFTRARDNGQHFLVKLLLPLRHLYAVVAARWVARGWLRTDDDVYFLVQEELDAVTAAGGPSAAGIDPQAKADARRRAYEYWCSQVAPDALDAARQPVAVPTSAQADKDTLVGIGASRGTITGVARVVLTPQEASRLKPGEILVTRATDPGWTPVFSIIGGAVIEIGGMLSHGAIVAREYGLPAVINVPQATRKIRDGQTITVDGSSGRVTLALETL